MQNQSVYFIMNNMRKSVYLKVVSLGIIWAFLFSCSTTTDINNEEAVMQEIQGDWIGCENIENMYRYIKLSINKDLFEVWIQTSDYQAEPNWAKLPDEKGSISLNSLQKDTETNMQFRKFAFICSGRCCGDKSSVIKNISNLISYEEGKGLTIDHKVRMSKK
jgi:hypothetical protein